MGEIIRIIDLAIEISENNDSDLDNIHKLGEGWVAEETLGIALYCALKYQNDFSKALIVSVNHNGDSDSTGAVTGNIMGALVGYDAIPGKWKKNLELADVILEMADDLCHDCQMHELSYYYDSAWACKYMNMHRFAPIKTPKPKYTFFWKDNEENGIFSNWYRRKIVIDDFEYFCVEQYMMAQKAKLFHDSDRYTQILKATTPWECKDLGRKVSPFDFKEWDAVRYDVVKNVNKAKFEQYPDLMKALLATGDSIMAEASPKDDVWGIGIDAATAEKTPIDKWSGHNLLGKALMELRAEFGGGQPLSQEKAETLIKLIKGDITKLADVDAIVNAANTSLLGGGGVDGVIHRAAGPNLLKECRGLHGCKTGEAKITGAYKIKVNNIIHTVGPVWNGGNNDEEKLLTDAYRNSLEVAVKNGLRSVAFPSISTGVYSFPLEKAAEIAVWTAQKYIEDNPGKLDVIEWVLFDDVTYEAYDKALSQVTVNKINLARNLKK